MKKDSWSRTVVGMLAVALTVCIVVVWAIPTQAADPNAGRSIYKKRCLMCHGENGAGNGPMGKMLKPPPASFVDPKRLDGKSDEDLIAFISKGKTPMPAFGGKLSPDDFKNVVAYIRTFAPK